MRSRARVARFVQGVLYTRYPQVIHRLSTGDSVSWFQALTLRERYLRAHREQAQEMGERLQRLEIAQKQLKEQFDLLEAIQERLMARWKGSQGGRPPKAAADPQNPLDLVPRGDKAALRAVLLPKK